MPKDPKHAHPPNQPLSYDAYNKLMAKLVKESQKKSMPK